MFLIDSHCHINKLNNLKKTSIEKILKYAELNNIKLILAVTTSIKDFYETIEISKNKENIFLSCGLHPLYNHKHIDFDLCEKLSKNKKVIAIGETGLDYSENFINKKKQIELFEKHIFLSKKIKKPIIIHSRKSKLDTLNILSKNNKHRYQGILHSFTEDIDMARKLLDMNFYISFSGIVTFKNAYNLKKILQFIPINKLLIETDAPYLTPEPFRGFTNQPAFLYYTAQYIKNYININFFDFIKQINKNFFHLFKIKY